MKNYSIIIGAFEGIILGVFTGLALRNFGPSVITPEMRSAVGVLIGGAVCGGFLASVVGTILGLFVGSDEADVYKGGLSGAPLGTVVGLTAAFIAEPTEPNSAIVWGIICGSVTGLILGMQFSDPLRGFERMSPAKRNKTLEVLRRKGPTTLPTIKSKAKEIRQRGYRIVNAGGKFDFNPEIELNELAIEIQRDHGVGLIGRLMGPTKQKGDKDA